MKAVIVALIVTAVDENGMKIKTQTRTDHGTSLRATLTRRDAIQAMLRKCNRGGVLTTRCWTKPTDTNIEDTIATCGWTDPLRM